MDKQSKLLPMKLKPLGAVAIKPEGWLADQLRIQMEGLSGHLDLFWPDIQESQWFGGDAEGWERAPYWLDGVIPLAWLLEDQKLQGRIHGYVNCILSRQERAGWLCPEAGTERGQTDLWAFFLVLKMLVEYYAVTEDERIEGCVYKALESLDRHIDRFTLLGWGQMRWFECLIPLWWLYERCPENWLLSLAQKLYSQGFDWFSFFENWPYTKPDEPGRWGLMSHGVNNAMMIKAGALLGRWLPSERLTQFADKALGLLEQYHGSATGVFTADECLSGISPIQGTELCAVVELMYSLEQLIFITGDLQYADRLERVAFNALPATFGSDMWTHQYDQQVNQIRAAIEADTIFRTNGSDAGIFGLEPHFGCCTANFSQGWSKFTASMVLQDEDDLVIACYAPCRVNTKMQDTSVQIQIETKYPFKPEVILHIETTKPIEFSIRLRRPTFCLAFEICAENVTVQETEQEVVLRTLWHRQTVSLTMEYEPIWENRPENMLVLHYGSLVFALPIEEQWNQISNSDPMKAHPHCDYEVLPKSEWRFALTESSPKIINKEVREVSKCVFSPEGAPLGLWINGVEFPDWKEIRGCAAYPAISDAIGKQQTLCLIPYGCTHLRITEFPVTNKK